MGSYGVGLLCKGASNRVVGYRNGQYVDYDVKEALAMKKDIDQYLYDMASLLSK
jgi:6-phosphofructokinase 1